MNIITNEILMLSKVIKVKDKVDKILKKYLVITILKKHALQEITALLQNEKFNILDINYISTIHKSPFLFLTSTYFSDTEEFIQGGFALVTPENIKRAKNMVKDNDLILDITSKKVAIILKSNVDIENLQIFVDNPKKLLPIIQHEWVHIEQYKKHKSNMRRSHYDKKYINKLKRKLGSNPTKNKSVLQNEEYFSRKNEIMAFAVEAAEAYVDKNISTHSRILKTYIKLGKKMPKLKRIFFKYYIETLQNSNVSIEEIQKHISEAYVMEKIFK
jgi:hypothetical protein